MRKAFSQKPQNCKTTKPIIQVATKLPTPNQVYPKQPDC